MRTMKKLLTGLLMLALVVTAQMPLQVKAAPVSGITLSVPGDKVLTYEYQKAQKFIVNVKNNSGNAINNIVVNPELRDNGSEWPFKTEAQKYEGRIATLSAGETAQVEFNFTERDDVPSARYTLIFSYSADGDIKGSQSFYVITTAKPEEKKETNNKKDNQTEEKNNNDGGSDGGVTMPLSADAGGYSNQEAAYSSGGGESGGSSGSVPRVIVTGFDTDPAEVRAGSNFKLTIHLKNTSKSTRVSNMLFDLNAPTEGSDEQTTAPAFLPASGSSSIYLEGIKANGTADISIQLNAKADLLQKPYSMDLSMKYEDAEAAQIEGASSISIPVKQDARFEFSEFEISPEIIAVGEEANVMCSLYNLGRIKLYNVKAAFEGTSVKKTETFIGNVESGATASIDATLEGTKESSGPDKVTMTLSYEDEAGKISSMTKELQLEVTAESAEDMDMEVMDAEAVEAGGFPLIPAIVIAVLVIVAAAAIIIIKKKKKKQMADEEEELLDELDGPAEDER